jgi:hypothetical protein
VPHKLVSHVRRAGGACWCHRWCTGVTGGVLVSQVAQVSHSAVLVAQVARWCHNGVLVAAHAARYVSRVASDILQHASHHQGCAYRATSKVDHNGPRKFVEHGVDLSVGARAVRRREGCAQAPRTVYSSRDARSGPVGYCSSSTLGFAKGAMSCRASGVTSARQGCGRHVVSSSDSARVCGQLLHVERDQTYSETHCTPLQVPASGTGALLTSSWQLTEPLPPVAGAHLGAAQTMTRTRPISTR